MPEALWQDVRYGARLLRKSPLFTITAVVSLAIGIGANTTIFSVASALLLRPMPGLSDVTRLVDVGRTQNGQGFDNSSYLNYRDLRTRMTTLEGVYAARLEPQAMSLSEGGQAERVYGTIVSANFFEILGTTPHLGRLLRDEDDRALGASPFIVISHQLWERRFASDPTAVGRAIVLNGQAFTIVGVAPRGFQGTTLLKPDLWVPISMVAQASPRMSADILTNRRAVWLLMGGRLKPGVTVQQANAEAAAIGATLEREYPQDNRGKSFAVTSMALVPGRIQAVAAFIGLLMTIVGLVLLIACVNVSGMLLARAAGRRREIAVRLAIGAGRGRLIRQLITETMLLFVAAGTAGVLVTGWLTSLLIAVLPQLPVPLSVEITTDWRVLSFAAVASLIAALLAGLAPALQASRADLVSALKSEGLAAAGGRLRLRNAFVVGQVTLSLVLVVAAGLFLRALQHAASIEPGFDQQNVDVVALDLSLAGYNEKTAGPFVRDLLSRVRVLPGVDSASGAIDLPLDGGRFGLGGISVPGAKSPDGQDSDLGADWNVIESDYFRTIKLPLMLGRDFNDGDVRGAQPVAIVNEVLARRAWPGLNPIGRQLEHEGSEGTVLLTVVGVTSNAKLVTLDAEAASIIYVPFAQQDMTRLKLVVRSTDGRTTIPQIRQVLRDMNPHLPVTEAMPLSQITAVGMIPQRIAAAVAGSLGIVGLLLAGIGIYGVTAYAVSRRAREIGIRMALGADRRQVLRLVLRQALVLTCIGIVVGAALAAAASRFVESLLFGVPGLDPITFAGASGLFALMTVAASYVPARRAMRVNPVEALRAE